MKIKRANGTMLILVVAFMLILIVFCMATLAMVTVANNRAVTKFEENQSYYTAASALEIFANGSLKDETYYAVTTPGGSTVRPYIKDDGTPMSPSKLTQGRALELDLYKLYVYGDGTNTKPIGAGEDGNTFIFTNALEAIINSSNAATFSTYTAYGDQFTVDPNYKYAEYTIELPNVSSSSPSLKLDSTHDYGLFADKQTTGTGSSATDYHAKIKVEVLERYYDMAGVEQEDIKKYMEGLLDSDSSTPTTDEAEAVKAILSGNVATGSPDATLIEAAILAGERHKDYFRIRVTSETELLGVKGITSREYVVQEIPTDEFDNSNISSGGIGNGDVNNAMYMTGGASAMTNLNTTVPGQIGPFYSEQDYFIALSGRAILSPLDYIFAKGHVVVSNSGGSDAVITNGNGAYIYGAKGVYIAGSAGVGDPAASSRPISVLSGGTFSFSSPVTVNGDIIADGLQYFNNQDRLTITGKIYVNDFYVPSSSVTGAITINGPTPSDNAIHVADAIYLDYDPVDNDSDTSTILNLSVGDAKIIANGSAQVYSRTGALTGTSMGTVSQLLFPGVAGFGLDASIVSTGIVDQVKLDYFNSAHYTVVADAKGLINRQFKLPNSLTLHDMPGDDTVKMPTTQSRFSKIMYSSFFTTNGDLATGSGTNVSAWDNSLSWNNHFDSNDSSTNAYRNTTTYFPAGATLNPTTVPGASMSFYGDTYGRYSTAHINAALRTAEAEYEIKVNKVSEAIAAATYPIGATAGYFNKYSTSAAVTSTKEVAAYSKTFTNTGSSLTETYTVTMPAGYKLTSSGVLNSSSLDPYNPPVVYIDAESNPIELQVNGTLTGTYIILGKKKVTFLVNAASGTTVKFGDDWKGALIMREKNYAMWTAGKTFGVGEVTGAEESSIGDTTVYVSTGAKLEISGGGGSYPTCIAANIIAFQSPVDNTADDLVDLKVDYNGIVSTYKYSTVGTVTSNNYTKVIPPNNRSGNLFMKTEVPPEDGKPNFNWNVLRYLSGQN